MLSQGFSDEIYLKGLALRDAISENFENDFPGSSRLEDIKYLKLEVQYEYARKSTLRKQQERFNKTIDYYRDFIDTFPESKYVKDAEQMYVSSLATVNKLKDNNL